MQRLYDLVVIDRNRPELGVKFGQLGAILDRCFLHFHHPERLAEQPGSDETGLARNARLLPLREEAGVLPVVQVKDMAMLRRVCEGGATALVGSFLFPYFFGLKNYDFGVIFTPARGKAFSGMENGSMCHRTHLAIF